MTDWRPPQRIRGTAQALIRRKDRLLVFELKDASRDEAFYRPIGGGIEFLETAAEAVVREFFEETGFSIRDPRYLGSLENIYSYEGVKGHELVWVFECRLSDPELYQRESFEVREGNEPVRVATWVPIDLLTSPSARFYPSGIKELARRIAARAPE